MRRRDSACWLRRGPDVSAQRRLQASSRQPSSRNRRPLTIHYHRKGYLYDYSDIIRPKATLSEVGFSRRRWLQIAGGTIAGLAVGGLVGRLSAPAAGPPTTVTERVTETVARTVTPGPSEFTLAYRQSDFRWHAPCTVRCPIECTGDDPTGLRVARGPLACPVPFGDWIPSYYQNWSTASPFKLLGNVLQTSSNLYSIGTPDQQATDIKRNSLVYAYDPNERKWIMQGGSIDYKARVRGEVRQPVTDYWRGYLEFDGEPTANTFKRGVGYRWSYIYLDGAILDQKTNKPKGYPEARWDQTIGAWLVGFSLYRWDAGQQRYDWVPFPDPFPVPGSNYNPLNL